MKPARLAQVVVMALGILLLCRGLTTPFNSWHEFNSALFSQFARNHIQYGLGYTKLYCTRGVSLEPPAEPERYLNHPPLLALFVATPLLVFGDHEWAARLVPIAATVGSAALWMTILTRLGDPLMGTVAGLFFVTLPLTVYFGRMVDHVAPVQFFSLLMIHGYLHATGGYGDAANRRTGIAWYAVGAALGIGTGWAAVMAAGLICVWHAVRVARRSAEARLLVWLAAPPAVALGAVLLHIAAGAGGNLGWLKDLAAQRSVGGEGGQQPWSGWLALQGTYFLRNFTPPGAVATILWGPVLAALFGRERRGMGLLGLRQPRLLAAVLAVTGLQGLLYVAMFQNSAWFHDYWQFFLGPFVAACLAGLAVTARAVLAPVAPRLSWLVVVLLVVAPVPWLASSLDFYARHELVDPRYLEALGKLRELVPRRAPVWTSRRPRQNQEVTAGNTHRRANATEVYHADRPLLFSRDVEEVLANRPRCAAYLLAIRKEAWALQIAESLARNHAVVPVGDHHLIFLLTDLAQGRPSSLTVRE
jgi:hypothetical protein